MDDCVELTLAARLEVVAANAGSLRKLRHLCTDETAAEHGFDPLPFQEQEALARAAPHLTELRADAKATVEQATVMLRNEAPFEALKLRRLEVFTEEEADEAAADEAAVFALAVALRGHRSLKTLQLGGIALHTPAVQDAVCAAAVDLEVQHVLLRGCGLGPASLPALEHLLGGKLQRLTISNDVLLDEAAGVQFARALLARHLTHLALHDIDFWNDMAAASAVLLAATGHPTLQSLDLSFNDAGDDIAAASAALGALVAANTSTLTSLSVWDTNFGDAGWIH